MDDISGGRNPHQKSVDNIAAALRRAEQSIETSIVDTGHTGAQVAKGRKSFGIHPSSFALAHAELGAAAGFLGQAMAAIKRAHDELEAQRVEHDLPAPTQREDGGGGK